MAYAFVLSISSTVDSFIVLNWIGHVSMAVVIAFLSMGSILDLRGLIMMGRGFGLKTTCYWATMIVVNILVFVLLMQLGLRW